MKVKRNGIVMEIKVNDLFDGIWTFSVSNGENTYYVEADEKANILLEQFLEGLEDE